MGLFLEKLETFKTFEKFFCKSFIYTRFFLESLEFFNCLETFRFVLDSLNFLEKNNNFKKILSTNMMFSQSGRFLD